MSDYIGRKCRYDGWPNSMYVIFNKEEDGEYVGDTYNHGELHDTGFRLTTSFVHERYPLIGIKVKDTRLARKMYPNAEVLEDGFLLIDDN